MIADEKRQLKDAGVLDLKEDEISSDMKEALLYEQISKLEFETSKVRKRVADLEISTADKKEEIGKHEKKIAKISEEISKKEFDLVRLKEQYQNLDKDDDKGDKLEKQINHTIDDIKEVQKNLVIENNELIKQRKALSNWWFPISIT